MARFDGDTILITGGSRGQGAAEARLLVAQGAKVVIGDVLENEGNALAKELGDSARFIRHDVAKEDDWVRAVQAADAFGGLTGLVNNAGILQPKKMMETDIELWERHIRVNQLGPFLGMKAVVPAMERSGGGSIVNVSSIGGMRGGPAFAYVATKWALRGMTKSAARELAGKKIRVNSIHPGTIDTSLLGALSAAEIESNAKVVPMGRMGTPAEVADLVAFLLADESAYITGAEITIDGGWLA